MKKTMSQILFIILFFSFLMIFPASNIQADCEGRAERICRHHKDRARDYPRHSRRAENAWSDYRRCLSREINDCRRDRRRDWRDDRRDWRYDRRRDWYDDRRNWR